MFDYAISTHVDKGTEKTLFILLTGKSFGYYNKILDYLKLAGNNCSSYFYAIENKIWPIKQLSF